MTLAAKTRSLSWTVHAVDDAGSVCGVRPPRGARWKLVSRMPINCPRCLLRLSRPRYATCETVTAGSTSPLHIRLVGPEGVCKGGSSVRSKTLCGMVVGWDIALFESPDDVRGQRVCQSCRLRYTEQR